MAPPPVDHWRCTTRDHRSNLVIRCAQHDLTAHEVRQLAARKLGVDPQSTSVARVSDPLTVGIEKLTQVIEVRWTGSDYSPGQGARRLQKKIGKQWQDL